LPPGDDNLAAGRQSLQHKYGRRSAIVDNDRIFSGRQLLQQPRNPFTPVAAFSRVQVKFNIAVTRSGHHAVDGLLGKRGSTEIGVKHNTGRVDDLLDRKPILARLL
jgi:hypothetical protein